MRTACVVPDKRVDEAISLVTSSRNHDGSWPLLEHHPNPVQLDMEGGTGKAAAGTRFVPYEYWIGIRGIQTMIIYNLLKKSGL